MPDEDKQDYSRRRSLIALAVIVVLFVVGWILVQELYQSEKLQDCLLSGRTNCAPIANGTKASFPRRRGAIPPA